ncbi:MAG TPA: hypothetical protein VNX29_15185 [Kaistia sp.]|nr:hypothetical protein [Kaistia sp.]
MMRALLLAGLVIAALAGPARATDPVLDGAVKAAVPLTSALLSTLPAREIDLSYQTSKGIESGHYRGVLLWTLVERAGLQPLPDKNGEIRRTLLITGRDGYAAALALGEIDPQYEGKAVLLSVEKDGTLHLLVPGDQHGGRNVRDVVRIEIR